MLKNKMRKIAAEIYHAPERIEINKEYRTFVKKYDCSLHYQNNAVLYLERMGKNPQEYAFSETSNASSIYSSAYACLLKAMYGNFSESEKNKWKEYFDSHQRKSDGLFCDKNYDEEVFFHGTDGWGARHLVPHLTIVYDRIGYTPKYEFSYLDKYKNPDDMIKLLDSLDYKKIWGTSNIIMNYGVAMQYARDRMNGDYTLAIEAMEDYLLKKINNYGMWYEGDVISPEDRNEMIRGAYHILPILYYDGIEAPHSENAVEEIIKSQNKWGGFDLHIGSSACEDIDGLDPLMRYSIMANMENDERVINAINRARTWVLFNQNNDGGFVFKKNTPFTYGNQVVLSSMAGESNLFATWFRCVSLELINEFFGVEGTRFVRTPGYELPLRREVRK